MRPFVRAALVGGGVALGLLAASYWGIWRRPAQVARRLEETLERLVEGRVEVGGASSSGVGAAATTRADVVRLRLDRDAAPWAEFEFLRLGRDPARPAPPTELPVPPVPPDGLRIDVDAGRLAPSFQVDLPAPPDASWLAACFPALRRGSIAAWLASTAVDARVDDLSVRWGGPARAPWRLRAVRCMASGGGEALVTAELDGTSDWDRGRVGWWMGGDPPAFRALLRLENVAAALDWRGLVPSELAAGWGAWDPKGPMNLDVRVDDIGGSRPVWRVETHHFGTTLRLLGPGGPAVEGFHGVLGLGPEGAIVRPPASRSDATLRVWGLDASIRGAVGRPTDALVLSVVPSDLGTAVPERWPEPLRTILARSRPRGTIAGSMRLEGGEWSGAMSLRDVESTDWPELECDALDVELRRRAALGEGTARVTGLRLTDEMAPLAGGLLLAWADGSASIATSEPWPFAGGTLTFGWREERALGELSASVDIDDVGLATRFLRARASGALLRATIDRVRGTESIGGHLDLREIELPRAGASGEALRFDRGFLRWQLAPDGIRVAPLELEAEGRTLRARGRVLRSGEIDLRFLQLDGDRASALGALEPDAPVASWVSVGERRDYTTWRLTGTLASPSAERVDLFRFVYHFADSR